MDNMFIKNKMHINNMTDNNQILGLINLRKNSILSAFIIACSLVRPVLAEESLNMEHKPDAPSFTRSTATYNVPDVAVIRQDGKKLSFIKELDDGRPVVMSFVFVSCSAICPMLTHVMSKLQTKLDQDKQQAHLISISIDPESDTPAKLTEYAKKFGADPGWDFYTGTRAVSLSLQKAFNTYRGDKMNHTAVILMRSKPGQPWLRVEGFLSADAAFQEYSALSR